MNLKIMVQDPDKCSQPIDVAQIEKKYSSTYIGDFCLKTRDGWSDTTAAIFYNPAPDVSLGHSHYFGIFVKYPPFGGYVAGGDGELYITKGDSAFSEPINGIIADDGEVIYSRYRHDFKTSTDGSVSIDGGRDYVRCLGTSILNFNRTCLLTIDKDKLVIMDPIVDQLWKIITIL